MTVILVSKCPERLKGELERVMFRLSPSTYVGKLTARVRNSLWEKVCDINEDGSLVMVFPAKNEQGFEVKSQNWVQEIVDSDGLLLFRKPKNSRKDN